MSASSSPSAVRSPLFTLEDAKIAFNIFCCICGIGSLGMPSNYARAGWGYATVALLFMAVSNIYATVLLSKVLMVAPSSVKTYGDLGEWVAGKWGRFFVVVSHMGVCLLAPCAFLVLGGTLSTCSVPIRSDKPCGIIFMAAMVITVALIPTLKESACIGAAPRFVTLSLAYAAAIVIPDLQRQHSQPERMPRVIVVSLGLASAFFLAIAIIGYVAGGCQLSGNLLFSIVNTSDPYSTTTLGFTANRGAVVMSYLFMQLHLSIAFSTILHPAFYMAERLVLGMHKDDTLPTDSEEREIEIEEKMSYLDDLSEYKGSVNVVRYVLVRIALIAILAVASILLKDHFLDLVDFTGATAITVCSLILPLIFYAKVFWRKIPMGEKAICITISTICGIVGCYVMIYAGKKLFNPDDDGATFPYCSTEYQDEPYYIRNSTVSN
ncbi:Amino Acid/Auxin Permease (AAAP) Family [Phytophthora infestans T30-4]|uniref:Amino Acid/Auxin Permease (AAAP) Family n=1 Tax=Phytophthora infestans (strain T30-4) TaxID=403677 RepID=D0NTA0_PHYIT|nr:Amino Acid/Auxin Permease (AAAP) Family [Phytophthora infestans T30-4]EEY64851.1 Amino Acid/Auxin Permease (AAAP) Family [Phytophthora infestans T30-4]|eukprot:XP_002897581.1 Amino Acid/Auxin Permease (AAAP) Family [Phytophthora infestans T30-4]